MELKELNDDNFEEILNNEAIALVDFYASWCGSCRMATPIFKKVAEETKIPFFKIDVEKNPKIKEMLSLDGLPTVGLFRNGEPVAAINTTKEEALLEFLKENKVDF